MRYGVTSLLCLAAACSSHTDPEQVPVTVTLRGPGVVTGTWTRVDTSRVLSCAYDLAATVRGGRADEPVEWTGATIRLEAPPALPATQEHAAARVAEWFAAAAAAPGTPAITRQTVGREAPFTAEYQVRYRPTRGAPSSATAVVQCRAP